MNKSNKRLFIEEHCNTKTWGKDFEFDELEKELLEAIEKDSYGVPEPQAPGIFTRDYPPASPHQEEILNAGKENQYTLSKFDYIGKTSSLPISGDVQKMAEERYPLETYLWKDYMKVRNRDGVLKDRAAFIAGHQARDGEVEKLVEAANHIAEIIENDELMFSDFPPYKALKEALKPCQSPVKEVI